MDYRRELAEILEKKPIYLYGAGYIAEMVIEILQRNIFHVNILGCIVTSSEGNLSICHGLPVYTMHTVNWKDRSCRILVATQDKYFSSIQRNLYDNGFHDIYRLTFESSLFEKIRVTYWQHILSECGKIFPCIDDISLQSYNNLKSNTLTTVYMATTIVDKPIYNVHIKQPSYIVPLQLGSALTEHSIADLKDNTGENISKLNRTFCEMTGWYWLAQNSQTEYCGLCHYRRWFKLSEAQADNLDRMNIDILATIPLCSFPNVKTVYCRDHFLSDWNVMLDVLKEYSPDYYASAKEHFKGIYYYAYNMFIARKIIVKDYTEWIFPILMEIKNRIEGNEDWQSRSDYQKRAVGFLAERLTSLYIYHQRHTYNIFHTEKIFLE